MKILHIGNKLSKHGFNPSTVETLSLQLSRCYEVSTISDKKIKFFRIFDIIVHLVNNRYKYDYVLIDTYSTKAFYFAYVSALLCRIFKIKYIPILHGGNLECRLSHNSIMSKSVFNYSFENISPSLFLQKIFESYGYKSIHIPNNIEISDYTFLMRSKNLGPKILWVRAFDEIYNPEMAIYMLHEIKKTFRYANLCMIGPEKDGSLLKCKELANALNVRNDVDFKGHMSKNDWVILSKKYSIFINTTNFDNMPVSILEIMALGLPIISTNVGGIPYLLEHKVNALLINKNDVKSMVSSIKLLLKDANLSKKLSLNGRRKVEQYSWEKLSQKWYQLFDSDCN
jgi:glycosyltransferase involved in cell wall biosynthesis